MTDEKDCCGDSSCIIQPAEGGMVTNGGCRCSPRQLKREILLLRDEVENLCCVIRALYEQLDT